VLTNEIVPPHLYPVEGKHIGLRKEFPPLQQFKIYHEPYLIWDRETWEVALRACSVYQIEADGRYAGDLLLEDQRKDTKYIIDFSVLPEYQGKGLGKEVVGQFKKMGGKFTAVT
jgi:RimJ/RimL family protein N-acetyltransferase